MRKYTKYYFIFLIFCCSFIAVSGSYAAIINASSCSSAHIQAAINSASSGDTVSVPAGTCTWTSGVTIPDGKTIHVVGAGNGVDGTVIKYSTGGTINGNSQGYTISNFRFLVKSGCTNNCITARNIGWRIHDNYFGHETPEEGDNWAIMPHGSGDGVTGRHPQGLIDNNTFANMKIVVYGESNSSFLGQCTIWSQDNEFGGDATGGAHTVYVENNDFSDRVHGNIMDANNGGKYVFRYNTCSGASPEIMTHSLQKDQERGTKSFEIYGNTITLTAYRYCIMFLRGGTGFVWGNTVTGSTDGIALDNVRSYSDEAGGDCGRCNGTSDWDENTPGESGWACRDQIGRGKDTSLWTDENQYPAQEDEPAYFWGNRDDGSQMGLGIYNTCEDWIHADRDYFREVASFDGSSGVEDSGTYAAMIEITPTTTGVGYWCTDKGGNWNKTNEDANDGCLYYWDGDSWEVKYTPLTYPHPLRDKLTPPSGLKVIAQ